jgi:hypothetical protein
VGSPIKGQDTIIKNNNAVFLRMLKEMMSRVYRSSRIKALTLPTRVIALTESERPKIRPDGDSILGLGRASDSGKNERDFAAKSVEFLILFFF